MIAYYSCTVASRSLTLSSRLNTEEPDANSDIVFVNADLTGFLDSSSMPSSSVLKSECCLDNCFSWTAVAFGAGALDGFFSRSSSNSSRYEIYGTCREATVAVFDVIVVVIVGTVILM